MARGNRYPGGSAFACSMIKNDIITTVMACTGLSRTEAQMAVEGIFEQVSEALVRGERIEFRGFGVFDLQDRRQRVGRNPRTGEEVVIPPSKAIRFRPGKRIRRL